MTHILFSCPACRKASRVQAHLVGRRVRCPHCQAISPVSAPNDPPGGEPAEETEGIHPDGPIALVDTDEFAFAEERIVEIAEEATPAPHSVPERPPGKRIRSRRSSARIRRTSNLVRRDPRPIGTTSRRTRGFDRSSGDSRRTVWIVLGLLGLALICFLLLFIFYLLLDTPSA